MKKIKVIQNNLWLVFTFFLSIVVSTHVKSQSIKRFFHEEEDKLEWIINGNTCIPNYELKHAYTYDSEERIKERKTFYWEKRIQRWLPYYKTDITYNDNNANIETAYWNWENSKFDLSKQLIDYTIDKNKEIVEYKIYIWDAIDKKWENQEHHLLQYHHAENLLKKN